MTDLTEYGWWHQDGNDCGDFHPASSEENALRVACSRNIKTQERPWCHKAGARRDYDRACAYERQTNAN